jgi:hypothetical protein
VQVTDDAPIIEFIDADPAAFGPAAPDGPPPPSRQMPWAPIVAALCGVTALGLMIVGLLLWKPWEQDPRLRLADPRTADSALSARLVFSPEPSDLRTSQLGTDPGALPSPWLSGSVGYMFAEAGATLDPEDGTDRWFGFTARPSSDPDTPMVLGQQQIAGVPAEVSDETGGDLVSLAWGPLDGWTLNAGASQMTADEAIAIAEQLHIVDGKPVLDDRKVLAGMEPLGPYGDFISLRTIVTYAQKTDKPMKDVYGVYYGFSGQSVVSVPGNESALDMIPFVIGVDPQERTVHGRRALGFAKGAGPFGAIDRTTVLWWEGGRLVLVAGDDDLDATFRLAETVHEATDAEWARVEGLD